MALTGSQQRNPEAARAWFRDAPGSLLLDQERALLEARLPDLFGYYLVQLGYAGEVPEALYATRVRQKIVIDPSGAAPGGVASLMAEAGRLPIRSDTVDAVLLVHTLDFAPDPHQVLREVERILIPEGRLVIVGFNGLSLWGLRRWWPPRRREVPWSGRFIGPRRIDDWLTLLGLEVELNHSLMFRPPIRHAGAMRRLAFMERLGARYWPALSGAYLIQAVKRVATGTPIVPAWRARRRLVPGGAVEPTARLGPGG
ncbi:MAG: methyltransferase domain-containing protein [Chromatiales bacterium]|jgi:SAM-dependent methyltransferase